MGKSTSCFKIITCGSDSADKSDDIPSENKGSSEKRGWSFRKRSARHRVLSNTAISESPPVNKESTESTSPDFQPPDTSTVPEKISAIQCTEEKPQLSTSFDSKNSETIIVTKDGNEVDTELEESVVIVIQAAVRRFLAQKELLKLKNVIKLQAAVRGHLVRQHAIGTLRCVQAIVKIQALVRARHARLLGEGSSRDKKSDVIHDKKKENSASQQNFTYISIEKLLTNNFARQLMESTPKSKPIRIMCDSSKPNSAWNWLERWMAISSAEPTPKPELRTEQLENMKNEQLETQKTIFVSSSETTVSPKGFSESRCSKSDTKETVLPSETEENLITYEADNLKFHICQPTSNFVLDDLKQPGTEKVNASDAKETWTDINSLPSQCTEFDVNSQIVLNSDEPKHSMKSLASEQLEMEGKVLGSKKTSNPALIDAQTKYEELSSTAKSSLSLSTLHQDSGVESNMDTVSSAADAVTRTKELELLENSVPHNLRIQYGSSECGTELSVTSTLDSPDTSEVGAAEHEHEVKALVKETPNADNNEDRIDEVKDASIVLVSDVSPSVIDHAEKFDGDKVESVNSVVAADSLHVELAAERRTPDVHRELDSPQVRSGPAYRSSPEGSPRSHIAVPESHGTPSSQVSVNAKKNGTEKSGSTKKRKLSSAGKRSPSNTNQDSGVRSSMEQLPKDQKNEKRRNSFGSTRPEHTDQEPRDSSISSSSVPHFMQVTESARAKINANNSPRSSPGMQDRDYIKKRYSLPGANGRQGSPRIQRSLSQAQQGAKGNSSYVVHGVVIKVQLKKFTS